MYVVDGHDYNTKEEYEWAKEYTEDRISMPVTFKKITDPERLKELEKRMWEI